MVGYILAGLGILAVGALAAVIGYVIYRVRKISQAAFGTSDIIEGFKQQEEAYATTPKSVSGMTNYELPRIMKDFPEFNWPEWKKICENTLRAYLEAIENHSLTYLKEAGDTIKQQADLIIGEEKKLGITECFDQLRIHRTEISRYEKQIGRAHV